MLKSRGLSFIIIALISVAVLFVGNSMMDSGGGFADIPDGVYEGSSDMGMYPGIKVAVTFAGGNITNVEVIEHSETAGISDPAIEGVPAAIVASNSTEVDVVSGATMTSNGIIDAVNNAIAIASGNAPAVEYVDGTYEGTSDKGMYEGLKVSVTVEGGKIVSVEVIEHGETDGIADPAIEGIPAAIVEAGTPNVDVVSGATLTSEAIMDAVQNALSGDSGSEEPEEVVVEEPEIEFIVDGTYEGTSDAGMYAGLKVAVTVEGGKIVNVEVVEHSETDGISDPAIEGIPVAIVEANSTVVDVVSGATYTSDAIMEATRLALLSAPTEVPQVEYIDGTYEGVSDAGMYEGLKVSVTVEGGVITSVEVVEHNETDGISDPAIEEVPVAIVAANSPAVDVVSGATYTSDAIIEAVELALEGAVAGADAPQEPAAGGSYTDGTYEGVSDAGMYPGLKVSVTVESGVITNVEVVEHSETDGISDPAIEGVPAAIVAANSTEVDVVSGATYTSDAIIEAVDLALEGAQ